MGRVMARSAVYALLALRRTARGRVVRHDARLFTEGGRRLLDELAGALPGLIADRYVAIETTECGTERGVLRVTARGANLLAELEQAWQLHLARIRSGHRVLDRTDPIMEQALGDGGLGSGPKNGVGARGHRAHDDYRGSVASRQSWAVNADSDPRPV